MPITVASSVASGAVIRMPRAPTMTRANTSRPSRSVPNQWSADGAARSLIGSEASGSWTTSSPNSAQRIQKPTRIAPMMKLFERTSSRNCSLRAVRPSSAGTAVAVVPASASSNAEESGCSREAHSAAPSRTRGLSTEYRMSAISVAIR